MSIPGLGQIPVQAAVSSTRTVSLRPAWEWRFQVPAGSSLVLKVLAGTAEKDGVELALRNAYTFSGVRSKILTWHGCELEIEGRCDNDSVAEYLNPIANPATSHINLHARLSDMRVDATRQRREGPRVLIAGPPNSGKTTLAKTLTSYATRQGYQVITVNANPRDGMLSLPGTLSASVFATVMDPEAVDGWGSTPTSGPSTVPVKLPMVFNYGWESAEEDEDLYRELIGRLAGAVSGRLSEDEEVRGSGVIVDGIGVSEDGQIGMELTAHVVDEFSINMVVVIGPASLHKQFANRFASEKTSLGEPIQVISIDESDGVVKRDEAFSQHSREAVIKEYFFGDAKRTLSPQIQQVDFDNLVIYKLADYSPDEKQSLVLEEPSSLMQHWTLAVMNASVRDSPDVIRAANVMGFVYVADVDEDRRKIKILAPVSGRLGDKPLVWGKWPEPYINLLG
ncbi:mRNA cleavage and polyadenylation factor CLP1 [Trichoderma asperellum]|uniref:Polynucleotide 5'-hydroxyl-kinase GRC3 n=1 Tax=Trichoderma asperellum TaxID=101201 RepID=A0A6V8QZP4_TRIAP|nr:Pre-mRNA cleavage complex II protein Clp1-domain-containing protein [Trichoderma asperelloides]GFP57545.1 mRNA cleavage and polyadenylation factor CLP1 [Trichoderma asperellum]